MIYILNRVFRDFSSWERPLRLTITLSLVLLVILTLAILFGPYELRLPACIGAFGLIALSQIAVMLAYRDMVSPLVKAQRYYLANDFESAQSVLEELRSQGKADVRALTVLGNTYRQLGNLEASKGVLYEALDKNPEHQFPLYGIGRTLLSEGDYAESAEAIQQALDLGAPEPVRADLGEALYYAGQFDQARAALLSVQPMLTEPHRRLMTEHLLARLGAGDAPQPELVRAGLPYWSAAAERFRHTPYGQALEVELLELHTLLKES